MLLPSAIFVGYSASIVYVGLTPGGSDERPANGNIYIVYLTIGCLGI